MAGQEGFMSPRIPLTSVQLSFSQVFPELLQLKGLMNNMIEIGTRNGILPKPVRSKLADRIRIMKEQA
jgi:hypothetical protein